MRTTGDLIYHWVFSTCLNFKKELVVKMERGKHGYEWCMSFTLYAVHLRLNHFSLSFEWSDTQE